MNKLCVVLILLCLFVMFATVTAAATIDATVKISICGNGIIEGGEDCESINLNGNTCSTRGYTGGTLTCDIACTFDVTSCSTVVPTAAPTSTPTPTTASTVAPTSVPGATDTPSIEPAATIIPEPTTFTISTLPTQTNLPPALQPFDINGTGKITKNDLPTVVKLWINEWKQNKQCDISGDRVCDMKDFSVLMYYVER